MQKNSEFIDKLRFSGLRPTKQRLKICEVLFNRDKTFHFTINDLAKTVSNQLCEKISLATIYNTVHAFKKAGHLKEILTNNNKSYYDTNVSSHHHFFDIETNELEDINYNDIKVVNLPHAPKGKKIQDVEVTLTVKKS